MTDVLDRGRAEVEARREYAESHRRWGYEKAQHEIRKSLVFRFYEDTLVNDRGMRVLGPNSPDPEIRLADIPYEELGWMGGQYRYADYTFDLDGFTWRANWNHVRHFGWELRFYVKRVVPFRTRWLKLWKSRTEWVQVYDPASLWWSANQEGDDA